LQAKVKNNEHGTRNKNKNMEGGDEFWIMNVELNYKFYTIHSR
jgi:hypothetical protein